MLVRAYAGPEGCRGLSQSLFVLTCHERCGCLPCDILPGKWSLFPFWLWHGDQPSPVPVIMLSMLGEMIFPP